MNSAWNESAVSLEKLDNHLKALLRLKIREFVHLSPWFKDEQAPAMPPAMRRDVPPPPPVILEEEECPHRRSDAPIGRRYVRASLHLSRSLQ